ncbi:MAG: GumC family protein [Methylocystis sp.]
MEPADEQAPLDLWGGSKPRAYTFIEPSGVWLFLRRNVWRMAAVAALATATAFLVAVLVFNKYSATAVVMVDPRSAKVTQTGGVLANIGADAIAIESLVQVARSEGFLGALVDQLNLTQDSYFAGRGATEALKRLATIEKLGAKLSVARRGTTYVIDVTATAPSPDQAASIANAAAQKILDDQTSLRTGASAMTAQEIQNRLAELRGRVTRAEQAVAELKARLKVTDAGQGNTLLERRVFELNQQLVLASAQTAEARARYELLRKAGASAGENLPLATQSTVLSALRAEYARLSRHSADPATVLGPGHPAVASLRAQLADVRRQINAEISRMTASARAAYLEAEQRETALASQLKSAQAESGALGPELVKLGELDREAKAERSVYEQLLNRQRELTQVKDLDPSDIRVVSPALPPSRTTPPRMALAAASAALGLIAGLAYAIGREWREDTLKTAAQVERLGGVEVMGFIPLVSPAKKDGDKRAAPDLSPWLADLSAELTPEAAGDEGLALLVASTRRGEGRTTAASNLAAYLAQGGDRVLLIEADRKADEKKPGFGLLDILETSEDLKRAFIEPKDAPYTLLPYGGETLNHPRAVGGLMSGMTMRAMLKLARQWFDVVVIDGPPALEAPHARLLAAQADRTVFVIEWGKTSAADVKAALARLDLREAVVLYNKADVNGLRMYDPQQSRLMEKQADAIAKAA